MTVDAFFDQLWSQSCALCPDVAKIDELLQAQGEQHIVNDHVAFRTLSGPKTGLSALTPALISLGYTIKGSYRFEEKKLNAVHLEHTTLGADVPKIFISELCIEEFSPTVQAALAPVIEAIPSELVTTTDLFASGRHWPLDWATHQLLADVSEYAGWFYAFGYMANHFTVSINHLQKYTTIEALNDFLENAGITLNSSGGKIKGDESVHLKQSATLAFKTNVSGTLNSHNEVREIPGVFREMAQRFDDGTGKLFQGFVEGNANTIFESTNKR